MRIALTGSGGTGKTVTAMEISRILNIPYVRSQARLVFERLGVSSIEKDQNQDPEKYLYAQQQILDEQIKVEQEATSNSPKGWITERTVLDTAAYVAWWCSSMPLTGGRWRQRHEQIQNECLRLVNQAVLHTASRPYDRVFVMPYGHIRLSSDLFRSGDAMYQRAIDLMIKGLTFQRLADRATMVPTIDGTETQVAQWIIEMCGMKVKVKPGGVVAESEAILAEPLNSCVHCQVMGRMGRPIKRNSHWICENCGNDVAEPA